MLLSLMIDLKISASASQLPGGRIVYSCVASGHPNVQLVTWQTGLGTNVMDSLYNTTSEKLEFSSAVTTVLTVDREDLCRESRGYTCIFRESGGLSPTVQSATIHCIPGIIFVTSIAALCLLCPYTFRATWWT